MHNPDKVNQDTFEIEHPARKYASPGNGFKPGLSTKDIAAVQSYSLSYKWVLTFFQ